MVLTGRPATITSNYRISYHLILGCLAAAAAKGISLTYKELVQQSVSYSHNSLSAPAKLCYVEKLTEELDKKVSELEVVRSQCQADKNTIRNDSQIQISQQQTQFRDANEQDGKVLQSAKSTSYLKITSAWNEITK